MASGDALPDAPPGHVYRQRLISRLDTAVRTPLTLVIAPAGWGKTALLGSWAGVAARSGPVRWLSAGASGDAGLMERLAAAVPDAGTVRAAPRPPVVVIDEFHRVRDPAVAGGLAEVIRARGDRLRLVLACRREPDLPVHRWRLSGAVTELSAADLSFTVDETAQLLTTHGIGYSESGLFGLHAATEGWAAGLRLGALARTPVGPEGVLTRDDGYLAAVGDYLADEVLDPLPPDIREHLLETSVVTELCAGLIDALTGRDDGERVLARLRRENLFLTRSAGSGGWYRYHPLFARTLYAELRRRAPDRVPELHRRAAAWHGARGVAGDALRQALLAGQWTQATTVLDRHRIDLVAAARPRRPDDVPPAPPGPDLQRKLALAFAADRLQDGDRAGTRRYLRTVELVGPVDPAFRLAEATRFGDPRAAFDLMPALAAAHGVRRARDGEVRAFAALTMGRARMYLGEWERAGPPLRDAVRDAVHAGLAHTQVAAQCRLAVRDAIQGQLRTAARTGLQALDAAGRFGLGGAPDLAWARLALAEVYHQWDRVAEARRLVDDALDLAAGDLDLLAFAEVLRARLRLAQGYPASALESVLAARSEFLRAAPPLVAALALAEAELRVADGDFAAAARLVAEHGGAVGFAGWAAVIEAAIALGVGDLTAALKAAGSPAAAGEPAGSASLTWRVQAALLAALVGRASGDLERVKLSLGVALTGAEAQGFRRPFVAGGPAVRDLLATYAPVLPVYHPVLAEFTGEPAPAGTAPAVLVEPLTSRELTVLRYLQGTMSNVEIAATLYVSVNTVKTHIRHIYRKLSAGRRREAVERARALRLL